MKTKTYVGNVVARLCPKDGDLEKLRSHIREEPHVSLCTLGPGKDCLIVVVPTTARNEGEHGWAARCVAETLAGACPPDVLVVAEPDPWKPLFEFFDPQDNKSLEALVLMRRGPELGMGKAYAFGA